MKLLTLKNGLKIAFSQNPTVHSSAINLFIACGSGDENEKNYGIAHFIEHMLFKGTKSYSNRELSEKMDMLGGQFNAYTTKEYTCLFCHVTTYDVPEALKIILEMATLPRMDEQEFNTERGVILEEINMYEDSPEDCAAEGISEVIFGSSGLAHNILGTANNIANFKICDLINHHKKYYVPERMVLSICGNFDEDAALKLAEEYLGGMECTDFYLTPNNIEFCSGIALREKDFEQSQIIIAAPSFPSFDDRRYAASVFSAIVGGNSSSRLNMHIREKLGLAYSIYSYPVTYSSVGAFLISAGTAHKNQIKVIEEILRITDEVVGSITEEELLRVKSQYRATSVLGSESISAKAAAIGRELLFFHKYTELSEVIEKINSLSLKDIQEIGKSIWQKERLALCVVGKPENIKIYKDLGFN